MDSRPTSELAFLSSGGERRGELPEWEQAYLELPVGAQDWECTTVDRHDQALPIALKKLGGRALVVAEWPRSGTGHYAIKLRVGGFLRGEHSVTITPRKVSSAAYSQLLEDLDTSLPASIAVVLQRLGAITGIKLLPPGQSTLAQELVRLRRAVRGGPGRKGLGSLLPALARDPHRILVSSEVWVPRERVRRIHPASLVRAFTGGHNVEGDGLPTRVPELRVEHTFDVYENRLVSAFYDQVDRRLRRLTGILEQRKDERLLAEAVPLTRELANARRQAEFLDSVAVPSHLPDRLTMVLLKRAAYRAALEAYLEFRRSATVRFEEPALEAPLENLPKLYETWGTMKVILALLEIAEDSGYEVAQQRLASRDAGGVFIRVLKDGHAAVVLQRASDSTTVKLIPQRSYSRRGLPLHSVSYTQRPDVVVEIDRAGRRCIYLFDPKYKLESEEASNLEVGGRPKKVDIDAMHAYRDAIRDDEGRRVVEFAGILYPGPHTIFGRGIEALPALPGNDADLIERLKTTLADALGNSENVSGIPASAVGSSSG